jgi:hypothetical protein
MVSETGRSLGVAPGAAAATSALTSGVAAATSTTSDVASPTSSASLGEGASSSAAPLVEGRYIQHFLTIKNEDLALPLEIAESFEEWKKDPSTFFLRSNSSSVPSQHSSSQVPLTPKERYDYALFVRNSTPTSTKLPSTSATSNKIIWGFITTVYHDDIFALSHSDRCYDRDVIKQVVDAICQSTSYNRDVVRKNILEWASFGKKLRALAKRIGGELGSLGWYFLVPSGFSEWK